VLIVSGLPAGAVLGTPPNQHLPPFLVSSVYIGTMKKNFNSMRFGFTQMKKILFDRIYRMDRIKK
jgi:hypothetical protein